MTYLTREEFKEYNTLLSYMSDHRHPESKRIEAKKRFRYLSLKKAT